MKIAMVSQCMVCKKFKMLDGSWSWTNIYDKIQESVENGILGICPDVCPDCKNFDGVFAERFARQKGGKK